MKFAVGQTVFVEYRTMLGNTIDARTVAKVLKRDIVVHDHRGLEWRYNSETLRARGLGAYDYNVILPDQAKALVLYEAQQKERRRLFFAKLLDKAAREYAVDPTNERLAKIQGIVGQIRELHEQ